MRKIRAETKMKEQEWGQLYDILKEKLGDWNLYWMVFDPRTDNEAIHGSLADDIADIYRDLKDGIAVTGKVAHSTRVAKILRQKRRGEGSVCCDHFIDRI